MTSTVDPRGNVPGADPADFTTTVSYDADGRPVTTTDPLGRTITTEYDAVGRPVAVTDPAGKVTTSRYNAAGWLMSVRAPGEGRTRYRYDRVGNLTKRVDSLSRETTYGYDAAGRVVTQTDPLGRVTALSYDVVGNLVEVVKPSGTATVDDPADGTVSYAYDAVDRLVATTFSDETVGFAYGYTVAGRVLTAARVRGADVLASSAHTYDDAGRVVSTVRSGPGGGEANYAYTGAGRVSGVAWSTGMSAAYGYNGVGQLTAVTSSGVGSVPVVEYAYDPTGRVSKVVRQGVGAPTTAVAYDGAGQVASLVHSAGSSVLEGYEVTRDVRGYPTQVVRTGGGGSSSALYRYDGAGRLKFECYPASGAACVGKSPRMRYTYDKVGNRTSQVARTVSGTKATTVRTEYVYDAGDQLLVETVDGATVRENSWTVDGALGSSTTAAGTQTFTTDLAGELVSVTMPDGSVVGYTHDAAGNRTSRSVDGVLEVAWSWDDMPGLPVRVGEYDGAGVLDTAWLPDPTSATGAPLAQSSGGVGQWLLGDPFANLTTAVSTAGTGISGTRTLGVFGGDLAPATGSLAGGGFGFSGQYLDAATGWYDLRARDYDPATGRFTAPDPVQVPTGMPYFATYTYGFNNPLMFTDPTGNWPGCGDLFGLCDSPRFLWNEVLGVKDAAVAAASALVRPLDTYRAAVDSCDAGFDQWSGGTGATVEGFLQCVDNLNPIASIRTSIGASLDAGCVDESGRAFGNALFTTAAVAAPVAKGVVPRPTPKPTTTATNAGSKIPFGPGSEKAWSVLNRVDAKGAPLPGYKGGRVFENTQSRLPETPGATYREWDVNPYVKGVNRGPERIVTGSDGSAYWTGDHYDSFLMFRGPTP